MQPLDNDETFWGPGGKAAFLERTRNEIRAGLQMGVDLGWWEEFDEDRLDPIAPPITFKMSDFPDGTLMAHIIHKAGLFPSVSQARKNGWDRPIEVGTWSLTKKKIRVRVTE